MRSARRAGLGGDDEFVLHRMLPADQFGDGDLVTVRFQLQAAQHVGELAAEFAGVDRVTPDFRQRRFAERFVFMFAQHRGDLGLAARHQHDMVRLLGQRKLDRVVGRRVAGVQRGDDVDAWRVVAPTGSIPPPWC